MPNQLARPSALKTLEFFVNYACNAKCPFCFNPPDASAALEAGLEFDEIARRLYSGYGDGYRAIKFIGGEVTVREDLPKMVALARRVGYLSIQITTNGIRLADPEYARRLFELGAESFRFSIHGHTPELHDRLVAVPGALAKIMRATKTLRGLGAGLGVNYVMNAVNFRVFPETCDFFYGNLGIEDVIVYFLRYQGFASLGPNRELLKLRLSEAAAPVREAFRRLRAAGHQNLPTLIHFPPCVLPELEAHLLDWTLETTFDHVTLPDGSGGLIHEITNAGKRKISACAPCVHAERCCGIESNYLELFGEAEFQPILKAVFGR